MFLNAVCTAIVKTSNKSNIYSSDSVFHSSEKSFSQLRNVGWIANLMFLPFDVPQGNLYEKRREGDLTMEKKFFHKVFSRNHEEDHSRDGQQNREAIQIRLDPWKGDRISNVHKDISTTSKVKDFVKDASCYASDHPHRPQRVNEQINSFNAKLDLIMQDQGLLNVLDHLPQKQKETFMKQVATMFIDFAKYSQAAIKDYGKITSPLTSKRRKKAFNKLEELNSVLTEMHDDLNKAKEIIQKVSSVTDEIEADRIYLSQKNSDTTKKQTVSVLSTINKAYMRALDGYSETLLADRDENKESRDAAWQELKNLTEWLEKMRNYVYKECCNSIQKRVNDCQNWFNINCPQILGQKDILLQLRGEFEKVINHATLTKNAIDSGNLEQMYLIAYKKQATKLEGMALEVIKHSPEVSGYYNDLAELIQRANKAGKKTICEIDYDTHLTELEKQNLRTDAYILFEDAYHSIVRAVRACGPKESPEQMDDALTKAGKKVLQVEINLLKHSSPGDFDLLSGLIKRTNETKKKIMEQINNTHFTEQGKQKLRDDYTLVCENAYHSITQAIRTYSLQESLNQDNDPIIEAKKKVTLVKDSLKSLIEQQGESSSKKVEPSQPPNQLTTYQRELTQSPVSFIDDENKNEYDNTHQQTQNSNMTMVNENSWHSKQITLQPDSRQTTDDKLQYSSQELTWEQKGKYKDTGYFVTKVENIQTSQHSKRSQSINERSQQALHEANKQINQLEQRLNPGRNFQGQSIDGIGNADNYNIEGSSNSPENYTLNDPRTWLDKRFEQDLRNFIKNNVKWADKPDMRYKFNQIIETAKEVRYLELHADKIGIISEDEKSKLNEFYTSFKHRFDEIIEKPYLQYNIDIMEINIKFAEILLKNHPKYYLVKKLIYK